MDALIYDAVRTPRGRGKESGSLHTVHARTLLVTALDAVMARSDLGPEVVQDVIVGCVSQVGEQGSCIARTAVLASARLGDAVSGATVNRFCGSGLEAVNQGAAVVASGQAELVISGGVESMSRVAMGADGAALMEPDMMLGRGLVPQGVSADLLATLRGIRRADVDGFALRSQQRAAAAQQAGRFDRSIVPVLDEVGQPLLARDEYLRPDTTLAGLAALKPSFRMMGEQFGMDALTRQGYPHIEAIDHIHHAGNSSGIVDGAAAVLIGSAAAGARHGLRPRARIRSFAVVGDEPILMLAGPMPASERALQRAGMTIRDIDLFEVNEAFAAVPLAFMQHFDLDAERVNVHGGAIALGHPLGATGAVLLGTLLDALEDRDLSVGLATLCIGGGMGIATIIERV